MKHISRRSFWLVLMVLIAGPAAVSTARSGEPAPHPTKASFAGMQDWPVITPGEVKLKNFKPFRAVYERRYKQASGDKAGEPRIDRVIVTAEEVGWHGRPTVQISLFDTGDAVYDDTNGRTLTSYVDLEDLSLKFELGPIPGKAKDYYMMRPLADKIVVSMVTTDEGTIEKQEVPVSKKGFGPGTWVMASMDLEKGMNLRLDPYYSPKGNPLTSASFGRVLGRKEYADLAGKTRDAWEIESAYSLQGPKAYHFYLVGEPPYYLGTRSVNLETGEEKPYVQLKSFAYLGE